MRAGVTLDDVCIAHAFDLTLRADGYGLAAKGQVAGRIVVDHAGQIVGAGIKLQDIEGRAKRGTELKARSRSKS